MRLLRSALKKKLGAGSINLFLTLKVLILHVYEFLRPFFGTTHKNTIIHNLKQVLVNISTV